MGRSPCCSKVGLNKGTWLSQEDKILTSYIKVHGEGNWRNLPKRAGLKRCGKSCRLRWLNYLKPNIKRGNISPDEEDLILRLHRLLGNRWSLIAGRLPGRTDNEIKNYWNTKFGKKTNPPCPQASKKGPSTATKVLKPLATKATRPEVIRPKNFDLHHKEINAMINYQTSEKRNDRVSTAYYSDEHVDCFFDHFENNVHYPFPQRNLLSVEDFLMEDWVSNVRIGGEYEINKNHKDMESLEMLLNVDEWL